MNVNRCVCTAIAALALLWTPAVAQTITDGDTLRQGGVTYRLWGIDAPEAKQVCPDGWPASSLAATGLQALTAGRSIVSHAKRSDDGRRIGAPNEAVPREISPLLGCTEVVGGRQALSTGPARLACREPVEALN